MNARLNEIEKIIDDYEKELRKLDKVTIIGSKNTEIKLELSTKSVKDFLIDFFYHNHLSLADTGTWSFAHTIQQKVYKDNQERTTVNRRRTAGDLFRLALKYYSEDVTLYEVMEAL